MIRLSLIAAAAFLASAAMLPGHAFAQATTTLNARILPIVWYSNLEPKEDEGFRVFSGIQNNSGAAFSGEVAFYADGTEIGRSQFTSASDGLVEASIPWAAAKGGTYSIKAKAFAELPAGTALVSSETDTDKLKVARVITLESVKEGATSVAAKVVEKIDSVAQALSAAVEEKRQEIASAQAAQGSSGGTVLGTSTFKEAASASPQMASVYGAGLGAASFLLDQWRWVVGAASLLVLFLIFKR